MALERSGTCTVSGLNLYNNSTGAQGAERIAVAVEKSRTVTQLDLGSNATGTPGTERIAGALSRHSNCGTA